MIKRKEVFIIVGSVIVLLGLLTASLLVSQRQEMRKGAAGGVNVRLSPPTATVSVGEIVSTNLVVEAGTNSVSGIQVKVSYDPSKLEFLDFQSSVFDTNFVSQDVISAHPGQLVISAVKQNQGTLPSGTFTAGIIRLKGKVQGSAALTIDATAGKSGVSGMANNQSVQLNIDQVTNGNFTFTAAKLPCEGIQYSLKDRNNNTSNFQPGMLILNITRPGSNTCSSTAAKNWSNVGVKLDNQSVVTSTNLLHLNGSVGYWVNLLDVTVGTHTLQFTVDNGSCSCNPYTFTVGAQVAATNTPVPQATVTPVAQCTKVTYAFNNKEDGTGTMTNNFPANSTFWLNIYRTASGSRPAAIPCTAGNWNNVALTIDNGTTLYTHLKQLGENYQVSFPNTTLGLPALTVGQHKIKLTVNNGACLCNEATVNVVAAAATNTPVPSTPTATPTRPPTPTATPTPIRPTATPTRSATTVGMISGTVTLRGTMPVISNVQTRLGVSACKVNADRTFDCTNNQYGFALVNATTKTFQLTNIPTGTVGLVVWEKFFNDSGAEVSHTGYTIVSKTVSCASQGTILRDCVLSVASNKTTTQNYDVSVTSVVNATVTPVANATTAPGSNQRVVGRIFVGDVIQGQNAGYTVTTNPTKAIGWGTNESGAYFYAGNWPANTNVTFTLTNPGAGKTCTWDFTSLTGEADYKKDQPGCTATVLVKNGSNSPDWQNHLTFRIVSATGATNTPVPTTLPIVDCTYTCIKQAEGDANCDGTINVFDFGIWRSQYGQTQSGTQHLSGDFNCDKTVNAIDFRIWAETFIRTLTQ